MYRSIKSMKNLKLLACDISIFSFMYILSAMNLSLRTAFIVSHKLDFVVFSFSFNSRKLSIFYFCLIQIYHLLMSYSISMSL